MSEFKKILVPIDFSDVSNRAFFAAVDLAKGLGASLHAVHIVQIHPSSIPESGKVNMDEIEAAEEQSANESLDKLIEEHGEGLEIARSLVHGDPVKQINKMVKEAHADVIVMGTHGRTGVAHLMMGSVAESVLRNADVPVMCVKGL
jgi:nucleotide-binding universal stress UspA family protein